LHKYLHFKDSEISDVKILHLINFIKKEQDYYYKGSIQEILLLGMKMIERIPHIQGTSQTNKKKFGIKYVSTNNKSKHLDLFNKIHSLHGKIRKIQDHSKIQSKLLAIVNQNKAFAGPQNAEIINNTDKEEKVTLLFKLNK